MSTPSTSPVGRRLLLVATGIAIVGALFALSFAYADHAPRPHGVRVALVASPAATAKLATGLDRAAPGGFRVQRVDSEADARAALRTQRVRGALVLAPGSRPLVLTAGAAGTSLQQAVQGALTGAARASGHPARAQDAVAPGQHDRAALLAFVLELALLVPSVIGSAALYLIGLRVRLWWRVAAIGLFAALVAALITTVIAAGFGAFTGAWPAVLGIAALGALAFVLPVSAAQTSFGLPATGVMVVLFVLVGNAASGGPVPTGLLPDVYRQLSPWLPNAAIVHAVRSVAYFGGHGLGQPLLTLGLWAGGGLLVLGLNDLLHLAEIRRAPDRREQVYATPGAVHAVRRVRGAPAGAASS